MTLVRSSLLLAAFGARLCWYPAEPVRAQTDSPGQHDDDHDHDSSKLTFEASLERIVRASRERFRPLKSFRVEMRPGRDFWYEVKTPLPEASFCRIYEHPELIYICEWSNAKAKGGPFRSYPDVVSRVEAALGEGWTRAKTAGGRNVARFEPKRPARDGVIEVLAGEDKNGRGLQIVVHAPPLGD